MATSIYYTELKTEAAILLDYAGKNTVEAHY